MDCDIRIAADQAQFGLMDEAAHVAEMVASNAPLSLRGTKAVASYWRHFALGESCRWVPWVNDVVLGSDDAKEGPRAFAEKRQPVWQGR